MFRLTVPETVKEEYGENYLQTLGELLKAQYGGNVTATSEGVFYDNAACDCSGDPAGEALLYEFMIATL